MSLGLFSLLAFSAPARAESPSQDPRAVYEALFRATLANPADLDAAFRFAEAAARIGDNEAAIGALERMLFYNPSLARVRSELGVLYFRLGAYGQARVYFTTALQAPDVPPEVRATVERFLAEIDKREQPNQISAFFQAGLRYQTNANAGPASPVVRVLGADAILEPSFRKRPDWNVFALGSFQHVYDFGNQRGDTWETSAQFYLTQQQHVSTYNTQAGEITSGPRFSLGLDSLPGSSVRVYGIGGLLALTNTYYTGSGGAGAAFSLPTSLANIETGVEFRQRNFVDSITYPLARQQSGQLTGVFFNMNRQLDDQWRVSLRSYYFNNNANKDFNGFNQFGLELGVSYSFDPNLFGRAMRWTFSPSIGGNLYNYDAANPIIDPSVSRRDREFHAGLLFEAPVNDNVGFAAQVFWIKNNSNIPNYRYTNFTVAAGPTIRF